MNHANGILPLPSRARQEAVVFGGDLGSAQK